MAAAYVHVPFCRQRCGYCDFPIAVLGHRENSDEAALIRRYADCLVEEIALGGAGSNPSTGFESSPLRSVYFGGGTPSLLPTRDFARILAALRARFGLAEDVEVTAEMDPGTFEKEKILELKSLGVNRASVGIQSLNEDLLRRCGRGHSAEDAVRALELSVELLGNVSADLLSGLPGQTEEQLRNDIRAIVAMGVTHVSVYDLQFEKGTPFYHWFPEVGTNGRPSDEDAARLYCCGHEELEEANFEHYEISSFARLTPESRSRSPWRSRHNQGYWLRQPHVAFGNGAASFVDGLRVTRPRDVGAYCAWVEEGLPASSARAPLVLDSSCRDDRQSDLIEALMLGLRTADGVCFLAEEGSREAAELRAAAKALSAWIETGHAQVSIRHLAGTSGCDVELRAKLLPPQGFLLSDALLSDAMAAMLRSAVGSTA